MKMPRPHDHWATIRRIGCESAKLILRGSQISQQGEISVAFTSSSKDGKFLEFMIDPGTNPNVPLRYISKDQRRFKWAGEGLTTGVTTAILILDSVDAHISYPHR